MATVIRAADGRPLKLPCKAEGLDTLQAGRVIIVCDEDRSPTTFQTGDGGRVTRRADQGVVMLVDLSGVR